MIVGKSGRRCPPVMTTAVKSASSLAVTSATTGVTSAMTAAAVRTPVTWVVMRSVTVTAMAAAN